MRLAPDSPRVKRERYVGSQSSGEPGDRAAILVIRMSRDVKNARRGSQAFEGLMKTRCAAIFRKRLGSKQPGGEARAKTMEALLK